MYNEGHTNVPLHLLIGMTLAGFSRSGYDNEGQDISVNRYGYPRQDKKSQQKKCNNSNNNNNNNNNGNKEY